MNYKVEKNKYSSLNTLCKLKEYVFRNQFCYKQIYRDVRDIDENGNIITIQHTVDTLKEQLDKHTINKILMDFLYKDSENK